MAYGIIQSHKLKRKGKEESMLKLQTIHAIIEKPLTFSLYSWVLGRIIGAKLVEQQQTGEGVQCVHSCHTPIS